MDILKYVHYNRHMNVEQAINAFGALAQATRLKVFKILIEYGQTGTAAGTISERLDIPHNTLSFHLSHLSKAGLITSCKQGRSIIYAANVTSIKALIDYLRENCCILEEGCATECNLNERGES
jgi:ArsR family transcriptional regulator, arsenate/arsenite/antimonite-responsive transcriptional repressor